MSSYCKECEVVASWEHELGHRSDCSKRLTRHKKVSTPIVETTLIMTQDETEALYFLLITLPSYSSAKIRLREVLSGLIENRKQLYGQSND